MHDANAAANRATRRPLTKDTEQETIIINRSGRSIYPEEKSVQTSGATSLLQDLSSNGYGTIHGVLEVVIDQGMTNPEAVNKSWPTLLKSQSFFELVSTFLKGRASSTPAQQALSL